MKGYTLINLGLIAMIAILIGKIYNIWDDYMKKPSSIIIKTSRNISNIHKKDNPVKKLKPSIFYQPIIDKNLFHPSRNVTEPKERFNSKIAPSKFILSGIVFIDNKKIAIVEDPVSRKVAKYNEGDNILDYTIYKITRDKIFLRKNGESFELKLFDKRKRKHRPLPKTKTPLKRNIRPEIRAPFHESMPPVPGPH
jgi:type II secretory pathway component PulC